jgi:hypothetical protein
LEEIVVEKKPVADALLDFVATREDTDNQQKIDAIEQHIVSLLDQLGISEQRKIPLVRKIQPVRINRLSNDKTMRPVSNNLILAGGDANIGSAENSIIIAGGKVDIAHSINNLVIAAGDIRVSHDGFRGNGSLLISRGKTEVSHAAGTLIYALGGVNVSHARSVCAFNTRNIETSFGNIKVNYSTPIFRGQPIPAELGGARWVNNCFDETVNIARKNPTETMFRHFDRLCYLHSEQPEQIAIEARNTGWKAIDPEKYAKAFQNTDPNGEGFTIGQGDNKFVLSVSAKGVCTVLGRSVNQQTLFRMIDDHYAAYKSEKGEREGVHVQEYRFEIPPHEGAMLVFTHTSTSPGEISATMSYLPPGAVAEMTTSRY